MNTVSVRVSYRPIRIGWCVADGSLESFRQAIRLSTTLWGGKFNPIISVGGDANQAQELIETFKVDALFPLDETPQVQEFVAKAMHLPWPNIQKRLFIQGGGGPLPLLLDVYHPLQKLAKERDNRKQPAMDGAYVFPNMLTRLRADGDHLSDAMLATFGEYPAGDECPIDYGRFADRTLGAEYLELKPGVELPGNYWENLTPAAVTWEELLVYKPRGGWDTPGVFVGDPASFSDLVAFWNLRAANIEVLFFPEGNDNRLISATRQWLTRVKAFLAESQPGFREVPGLWTARDRSWMPQNDWGPYKDIFDAGCSTHHLSDGTWNGLNVKPPRVHFEEHSVLGTVDGDENGVTVSFPLGAKPFLEAAETQYQHAIVTARPLIDPKPSAGTLHLPNIPQLNRFYGRGVAFSHESVRSESDGLGVVVKLHDSNLQLKGIPVPQLLAEIFRLAGITAKQSTAGKIAFRLIQHMGGLDGCRVFKIRGVRDLLHEYGGFRSFSHREALARIGPGFDLYKSLFIEYRDTRELTPQDAFLHLVKKKVIRPGLQLDCANCELPDWHSLDDLAEQVSCPFCGAQIHVGPQLRDTVWHYRLSGLFARTRDHEGAIPVTLALLQALRCFDMWGMTWLTGMDLSWGSGKTTTGETDLVVLTQNYEARPELLIGECKTNKEIDEDQIGRLVEAGDRLRNVGIKTFIMFAKAGGPFSERELDLIDKSQTLDLNFILLSPVELEPYDPYENRQSEKIPGTPHSLAEWASCSQALYLKTSPTEIWERYRNAASREATG